MEIMAMRVLSNQRVGLMARHLVLDGIASRELATKTSSKPVEKQSVSFDLSKKEKQFLRKKLLEDNEGTQKQHIFKQLYPWRSKLELAEYLKKSEVYNSDGLIAVCKPYGIAQVKIDGQGKDGKQSVVQTLNSGGVPMNTPALKDVLPVLQEMYNADHLEIVKTSERWTSGLLLLSTNQKVTDRVKKCFRRSKSFEKPPLKFWTVTNGLPKPNDGFSKVAISLEYIHGIGKIPVIKKKYATAEIKRGESKSAVVKYSTLMHNEETQASLVEINIQTMKWHFLRVWLAHMCTPVLGDAVYGGRVKILQGKKMQISPHNLNAYQPQEISNEIYQQLDLPEKSPDMIPALIHLAKINLAQYNKDKSDLTLTAAPPEHFMWTCKKMGLMSDAPEIEHDESVKF